VIDSSITLIHELWKQTQLRLAKFLLLAKHFSSIESPGPTLYDEMMLRLVHLVKSHDKASHSLHCLIIQSLLTHSHARSPTEGISERKEPEWCAIFTCLLVSLCTSVVYTFAQIYLVFIANIFLYSFEFWEQWETQYWLWHRALL
jgi:hypothetical protein